MTTLAPPWDQARPRLARGGDRGRERGRHRRHHTGRRGHRLSGIGSAVMSLITVMAVIVIGGGLFGFRTLVITSGSMTPTIDVGAAVLSRSVDPLDVRPGDIVTFRDPSLGQQLVTHRVVQMRRTGQTVTFVTKGDANHTTEHWSISVSGRVGRLVVAVPEVGRVLASLTRPLARVVEIVAAMGFLAFLLLRWIWFTPRAGETAMPFLSPESGPS